MAKTYRVRPNITPEQIAAAVYALKPFYGFGAVLDTANEKNGRAGICFYDGTPGEELIEDGGIVSLETIDPEGCIAGITGSWDRVPAAYCGPILRAKDFFAARDAFMACIESVQTTDRS